MQKDDGESQSQRRKISEVVFEPTRGFCHPLFASQSFVLKVFVTFLLICMKLVTTRLEDQFTLITKNLALLIWALTVNGICLF